MPSGVAMHSAMADVTTVPNRNVPAPKTLVTGFQVVPVRKSRPNVEIAGRARSTTWYAISPIATSATIAARIVSVLSAMSANRSKRRRPRRVTRSVEIATARPAYDGAEPGSTLSPGFHRMATVCSPDRARRMRRRPYRRVQMSAREDGDALVARAAAGGALELGAGPGLGDDVAVDDELEAGGDGAGGGAHRWSSCGGDRRETERRGPTPIGR